MAILQCTHPQLSSPGALLQTPGECSAEDPESFACEETNSQYGHPGYPLDFTAEVVSSRVFTFADAGCQESLLTPSRLLSPEPRMPTGTASSSLPGCGHIRHPCKNSLMTPSTVYSWLSPEAQECTLTASTLHPRRCLGAWMDPTRSHWRAPLGSLAASPCSCPCTLPSRLPS